MKRNKGREVKEFPFFFPHSPFCLFPSLLHTNTHKALSKVEKKALRQRCRSPPSACLGRKIGAVQNIQYNNASAAAGGLTHHGAQQRRLQASPRTKIVYLGT